MGMPAVVIFVGKSGSGKTTFLEKLILELKRRDVRVGTIKHDGHGFEIDRPGKDTWRHAGAGADAVLISGSTGYAMIRKVKEEAKLDRLLPWMSDMDIVLVEGFKRSPGLKIEINRAECPSPLLAPPEELIALVSDAQWDVAAPVFDPEDASGVADLLQEKFRL